MSYLRENNLNFLRNLLLEEFPDFKEFHSYKVDLYRGTFIELYNKLDNIDIKVNINDSLLEQNELLGKPDFSEITEEIRNKLNDFKSKRLN